jgi:beta-lactamase class A
MTEMPQKKEKGRMRVGGSMTRDGLTQGIAAVQAGFSGQVSVAAKLLETGEEVMIDADRGYPTASTFKIPIMAEIFRQAEAGGFNLDDRVALRADDIVKGSGVLQSLTPGVELTIRDLAMLMIIVSDNTATNMLIDRAGGIEPINAFMRDLGLDAIVIRNRIDFDAIGDDNRALAEASPRALMRLCELIVTEKLVSAEASREMLRIMREQHYRNQFPRYLEYNPYGKELHEEQSLWIANKTGSLKGMRADAGIIGLPGGTHLIFGVMTEGSRDMGFTQENEAELVNGVIGRLLVEYWWPGDWEADKIGRVSPYLDAALTAVRDRS